VFYFSGSFYTEEKAAVLSRTDGRKKSWLSLDCFEVVYLLMLLLYHFEAYSFRFMSVATVNNEALMLFIHSVGLYGFNFSLQL
jgi:hypothetical protein